MAERSQFWDTGTTGDGATTITQAQTTEWMRDLITPRSDSNAPNTSYAVLRGVLNELAVSAGSGQVSVATGAAIVAGFYYKNDAAVAVAIPTPAANTRIDRIVLRASHGTTRTVRIARVAGTEGAGAPALTQTAGTTWEILLAQVSITTGGVITVTDGRAFAQFATNHVKRDGDTMTGPLTVAHTAPGGNQGFIAQGPSPTLTLNETDAAADNRLWDVLADAEQLAIRALNDAANVASNAIEVDRTATTIDQVNFPNGNLKAKGYAVPHLAGRQGGSASDWGAEGTTNYTPGDCRMQVGAVSTSGGTVTITFPVAFAQPPVILASVNTNTSAYVVATVTATQATFTTRTDLGSLTGGDVAVNWIAIGPLA